MRISFVLMYALSDFEKKTT